ncbi:MAG: ribbon-helix-helix domain-containing protein [Alphaproteobacteria bacterium]|nr:ribbon-helix-helix domain-containing protein [Alphaproteobacteria bacterium]
MTDTAPEKSSVIKRSVTITKHRTSVSLEKEFWDELKAIAEKKGVSVNQLIAKVDASRQNNLSSALRIFVLDAIKSK